MTGTALVDYSATRSAQHSTLVNVSIPCKTLFKYPTERYPPSNVMNTFWRGVLKKEFKLEAYELLSGSGEEITTDEIVVSPDSEIPNNTSMCMNY